MSKESVRGLQANGMPSPLAQYLDDNYYSLKGQPIDPAVQPYLQTQFINIDPNVKDTAYWKTNILKAEEAPFDGAAVVPRIVDPMTGESVGKGGLFTGTRWDDTMLETGAISDIQTTAWSKFQNILLYQNVQTSNATGVYPLDWMDAAWLCVPQHWESLAKIKRGSNGVVKGFIFDPEPQNGAGNLIWTYSDRTFKSLYSLATYEARIYESAFLSMKKMIAVDPQFDLCSFFTYYQLAKANGPTNYQMFQKYLDGWFDAAEPGIEIHDMTEDAYGIYENTPVDQFNQINQEVYAPLYFGTTPERLLTYLKKGNTTWLDDTDSGPFDINSPSTNYFTPARLQQACTLATQFVDSSNRPAIHKYHFIYNETVYWCTASPTVTPIYFQAVINARAALGYEVGYSCITVSEVFSPKNVQGINWWLDPFTAPFADNGVVSSYTDPFGNVWSGVASPTFKKTGFSSLYPAFNLVGSSSQYLKCDALATPYNGEYMPFFMTAFIYPTSISTNEYLMSIGKSGSGSSLVGVELTSAGHLKCVRTQDDGGSDVLTTADSLVNTGMIVTYICDGANSSLRINANRDANTTAQNQTTDNMVVDSFSIGCLRQAANSLFFTGLVGSACGGPLQPGLEQVRYLERGFAYQYGGISLKGG